MIFPLDITAYQNLDNPFIHSHYVIYTQWASNSRGVGLRTCASRVHRIYLWAVQQHYYYWLSAHRKKVKTAYIYIWRKSFNICRLVGGNRLTSSDIWSSISNLRSSLSILVCNFSFSIIERIWGNKHCSIDCNFAQWSSCFHNVFAN